MNSGFGLSRRWEGFDLWSANRVVRPARRARRRSARTFWGRARQWLAATRRDWTPRCDGCLGWLR